jgi:hypothetical protein
MSPFLHNVTFAGVDVSVLARVRPAAGRNVLAEMVSLWLDGRIRGARPTQTLG